jgi:prepilin-type processing-associated H-X9-DG protein
LSSSGSDSPDPFGPRGPVANNVPAVLYLLVRTEALDPDVFICPSTADIADDFGGRTALSRSNFSDVRQNLSYSVQNPYVDGANAFTWSTRLSSDFAVVADRNPGSVNGHMPTTQHISEPWLVNSRNHQGRGQNVLYVDGRVEFHSTPLAGVKNDHIYLNRRNELLGSPVDSSDSILLSAPQLAPQ